jgi:chemotaxis protein CheZ
MSARRKVFRIEGLVAARGKMPDTPARPPHDDDVMQELGVLRTMPANALPEPTSAPADTQLRSRDVVRVSEELRAAVRDSEQATQKILAAAEDIDRAANNLSAILKNVSDQGLAQDIRDRVIQIFEACNFQDVTSQRVTKVMAALDRTDDRVAVPNKTRANGAPPVHGPRLAGDAGHVTQRDIDSFFAEK